MSERTSRHYWTSAERKALLILHDEYQLAWNSLTPLFNSWLGQTHGLLQQVLYSQYIYISHTPSKSRQQKVQNSLAETNDHDEDIRDQLRQTATKLGIHLVKPDLNKDNEIQHDKVVKRKRSLSDNHTPNAKRSHGVVCDQMHNQPCTPKHHCGLTTPPTTQKARQEPFQMELPLQESPTLAIRTVERSLSNAVVTKPKKRLSLPTPVPQMSLPLIGFRGFSDKSQGINSPQGFRAGAFMRASNIPQCPAVADASFIAEATSHVGWTKGRPSPFISITTSCIRAIMKSRSPKSGRFLAVLDLHKIRRSGSIFEAKSLSLKPTTINGTPIKYQSGGEYLIWGVISADAIISVIPIETLVSPPPKVLGDSDPFELGFISTAWRRVAIRCIIAKNGRMKLSYQAGLAVGEFIKRLRLNSDYNAAITSLITSDWQFDMKRGERWQENPIFCQGLNLSLEKAGQTQHPNTSNHLSQVGFTEHRATSYQEDNNEDYLDLLEQLKLAMSDTATESSDEEVVYIENRKETGLTSSGQSAHDKLSAGGTISEARAASSESPAFSTDQEDFVIVSADRTSSSSTSQQSKNTSAGDEIEWPSWTGM